MPLDIYPLEPGTDVPPFTWQRKMRAGWKGCGVKAAPAGLAALGRRKKRRQPTKPWEANFAPTVLPPDGPNAALYAERAAAAAAGTTPPPAPTVFDVAPLAPVGYPAPQAAAYPVGTPYGVQSAPYPVATPYGVPPSPYPASLPYNQQSYAESIGYSPQQLYAPPGYSTGYAPDYSAMPEGLVFDESMQGQLGFFGPLLKGATSIIGGILGKKKKKAAPVAAPPPPPPQVIMQPAPASGADWKTIVPIGLGAAVLLVLLMQRRGGK